MPLFCMCKITGRVPTQAIDSQGFGPRDGQCYGAPNRYGPFSEEDDFRMVFLGTPMEVVKNGAPQAVCHGDDGSVGRPPRNMWAKTKEEAEEDDRLLQQNHKHYPNVDVYRCPNCGAEVVRDS